MSTLHTQWDVFFSRALRAISQYCKAYSRPLEAIILYRMIYSGCLPAIAGPSVCLLTSNASRTRSVRRLFFTPASNSKYCNAYSRPLEAIILYQMIYSRSLPAIGAYRYVY